jgi:L-malate glycosyltransferase
MTPRMSSPMAGRKRIFYIVDSFQVGGTESQATAVAIRMHGRGYEVTVGALSMKGPLLEKLYQAGVPVMSLSSKGRLLSLSGLAHAVRLALFLRSHHFDLVHAHDLWSNLLAVPSARAAGIPVIVSRRNLGDGRWFSTWRGRVLRFLQKRATLVITNAGAVRDLLISRERLSPAKVQVVHNGVEWERFANVNARRTDLLPGAENKRIVVVVANMYSAMKGHGYLIDAAPRILRAVPEACFVLVGDGSLRAQLERQARDRGVSEAFLFLGCRSDVAELLACSEIALLPSLAEGLPNSVLEYMSAGLPIIATHLGGIPELIANDHNGILVPPADSEALATAVIRLLRDPESRRRMGHAAQERARHEFTFERLTRRLERLYSWSTGGECEQDGAELVSSSPTL